MRKTKLALVALLLLNLSAGPLAATTRATAAPAPAPQGAVLTNADVLMMLKMGLSSEVIIAKIKVSNCSFDTSPVALQELKNAKASDSLILAMMAPAPVAPAVAAAAAQPALVEVRVPDGTALELELQSNITSKEAQEGDIINFTVVNPIVVNGVTIIERGAPAKARVAVAKKSGRWGRSGKLGWAMQDVLAADGTRIALRMEKKLAGDSKGGTVATGIIVTSLVFWPAAPLWGFKKGKEVTMPAGKRFEAFVHGDTTLKGKQQQQQQ